MSDDVLDLLLHKASEIVIECHELLGTLSQGAALVVFERGDKPNMRERFASIIKHADTISMRVQEEKDARAEQGS